MNIRISYECRYDLLNFRGFHDPSCLPGFFSINHLHVGANAGAVEVPLLPWQHANGSDLGSLWCAKDGLPSCTSYKVGKLSWDGKDFKEVLMT